MSQDHELRVHRSWIGLLQPVGLVVSPPALMAAQAFPDKNIAREQQILLALVTPPAPRDAKRAAIEPPPLPLAFETLATQVLGWKANKLVPAESLPESLSLVLPELGETLRPTYAVPAPPASGDAKDGASEWLLLVDELPDATPFDEAPPEDGKRWHASPQVRLERLLRETGVGIGILANGRQLRLVYAPRGESSGHITWPIHRLTTALDREMLSVLCMLLGAARLFSLPRDQRLPHILKESRKYQNVVSTKLAGQVLEALNELLRGFQAANEASRGSLLDATVREDPDHVYGGLLAVLLRLVFILYAEERGLLSASPVYVRNYSLSGLFEKLRSDAGRFPDTMDQRYGAWSRLLVLFRMVHDGARRGDLRLPPRYGHLFDPDGWSFLEGRMYRVSRVMGAPVPVPKVADGVILRVLEKLLLLDGDRLSYRALDVEQIGSVYENMMGFRLEQAAEISIGVGKQHVVVGLETLLAKKGAEREKHLKDLADVELSGKAAEALKAATTLDDLVAAISKRISALTPRPVPADGLYLQPTDERRRSGSHYTPRELTEPIVRTTLRPILEDLGPTPKPEQILALKVCDPAMGSGAFLVETCRQLADQLVKAYDVHGRPTDVPPDEDILLYAQRQVAQHCLYGVDKNPLAVDLGKLSLWLATLARDHAFTFLDHSIRHGDSLVGLSREQIASFHWAPEKQVPVIRAFIDKAVAEAMALRAKIPELANSDDVQEKQHLLQSADHTLTKVRLIGDAVIACFFAEQKSRTRKEVRRRYEAKILERLSSDDNLSDIKELVHRLRNNEKPTPCFHWEIEYPEVFARSTPGFDVFVGNPPFMGGNKIWAALGENYGDCLAVLMPESGGRAVDLVVHFFRRAFSLLRSGGALGLLATKTIAQGDTRRAGLEQILRNGGFCYAATKRRRWPGLANVVVSVVHILRNHHRIAAILNEKEAPGINSHLLPMTTELAPSALQSNIGIAFMGCHIYGSGFKFDDSDTAANPVRVMHALLDKDPRNSEVISKLIAGEDITTSIDQDSNRWAINFRDMSLDDARSWPDVLDVVEHRVRPERVKLGGYSVARSRAERWWIYGTYASSLYRALSGKQRCLALSQVSAHHSVVFHNPRNIFSHSVVVFVLDQNSALAVLQSRIHEVWTRFFSSSMKDDLRYTPSDCFDTFPFPANWERDQLLEAAGRSYDEFRSALMKRNDQGLTKTYNRFHDPDEADIDIVRLRELHDALDRSVFDAYGWSDIQPACEFLLDYEEDNDDTEASGGGRRKKKPWRYRWPDEVRDEVLARLLELNAQRAKEQTSIRPPDAASASSSAKKRGGRSKKAADSTAQGALFDKESE